MVTRAERIGQKFRRDSADAMASTSVIDYLRMMGEQARVRRRHENMVDVRQKCLYPDYEPYDSEDDVGGSILYNNVICTDEAGLRALLEEESQPEPPKTEQPARPQPRPKRPGGLSKYLGPLAVAAGLATGGGLIGYGLTQIPTADDTDTDTVTVIGIE